MVPATATAIEEAIGMVMLIGDCFGDGHDDQCSDPQQ